MHKKFCVPFLWYRAHPNLTHFCPREEVICCHFCPKSKRCRRGLHNVPCCSRCRDSVDWRKCPVRVNFWEAFGFALKPTDENYNKYLEKCKYFERTKKV